MMRTPNDHQTKKATTYFEFISQKLQTIRYCHFLIGSLARQQQFKEEKNLFTNKLGYILKLKGKINNFGPRNIDIITGPVPVFLK